MTDDRSAQRPSLLVFDVNETLSDLAPLADRFAAVGAPPQLAATWFAALLRDGFALTALDSAERFAVIAKEGLAIALYGVADGPLDDAVSHVLAGLGELDVHPDVAEGIGELAGLGITLVTLSNGAASVAETLLTRAGIRDRFAQLLSVEDAGIWKPAAGAYEHALQECDAAADAAMLVAVHPWDIEGAHRAGLRTAWINRSGGPFPAYFSPPDVEASSLVDLADRLR